MLPYMASELMSPISSSSRPGLHPYHIANLSKPISSLQNLFNDLHKISVLFFSIISSLNFQEKFMSILDHQIIYLSFKKIAKTSSFTLSRRKQLAGDQRTKMFALRNFDVVHLSTASKFKIISR